jgi:hypothetical protein
VGSIATVIRPPPVGLNCMTWQELKQFLCDNGVLPPSECAPGPGPGPGPDPGQCGVPGLGVMPMGPPATAPTGKTRSDPIEMIWYKPLGDYRNPIWLTGTPYYRNQRQRLSSGRWIGVGFWPGPGDVLHRVNTPRGRVADEFMEAIVDEGFEYQDEYSPDHVQDLMFEGADDFRNLWPLDRDVNSRAGTGHSGQGVWFSEPGDPTPICHALGSWTLYGRYFVIRQVKSPL